MPIGLKWVAVAVMAGAFGLSVAHSTPLAQASEPASQDKPIVVIGPDQPDIIVTGERPAIRGGLWKFTRSATMGNGSRSFRFAVCLPDSALEAALRAMAGEQSAMPRAIRCSSLRLKVADGRIRGGRSCLRPVSQPGAKPGNSKLDVSGRYDAKRLTINFLSDDLFDGMQRGGGPGWNPDRPQSQRWQVEATRTGDCPAERRLDQRTLEEVVFRLFDPGGSDDDTVFPD
ncbi:hypothetical protein ASG67_09535 [Sphingomonas sp. Leaf339]|uniref:hypothetical protein n=1 Tax=Sphingomonas sp. Leaf339 TaxID=1736343 RepID=UPI000700BC79|nr:hypothetical protein [Sphingomonas sp. Leaf339]KQU53074.1 hypothetical protein ASG67_09535 [Sphingomonas sp. Leaf339]